MNEIERTECNKLYEIDPALGLGTRQIDAFTGPIHYKENYAANDLWLDLDENYREDMGDHWLYPKIPNITKVFKNACAYEMQNRNNRDHTVRVELVSVNGNLVSQWVDDIDVSTFAKVHPYRVGIWKKFKRAKNKTWNLRWKVTEIGRNPSAIYVPTFKEIVDAWTVPSLDGIFNPDDYKINITGTKTRIDDNSFWWDEAIPRNAMLIDTDYQVGAGGNDGYWKAPSTFNNSATVMYMGAAGSVFARWTSVAVDVGATITAATFSVYNGATSTTVYTDIYFNDEDNASAPTTYATAAGKVKTTATVAWDAAFGSTSTWYTSPSIKSVVQEVVDRAGWAKNNAMMLLWIDGGGNSFSKTLYAYEASSSYAAKLSLTWSVPLSINVSDCFDARAMFG